MTTGGLETVLCPGCCAELPGKFAGSFTKASVGWLLLRHLTAEVATLLYETIQNDTAALPCLERSTGIAPRKIPLAGTPAPAQITCFQELLWTHRSVLSTDRVCGRYRGCWDNLAITRQSTAHQNICDIFALRVLTAECLTRIARDTLQCLAAENLSISTLVVSQKTRLLGPDWINAAKPDEPIGVSEPNLRLGRRHSHADNVFWRSLGRRLNDVVLRWRRRVRF